MAKRLMLYATAPLSTCEGRFIKFTVMMMMMMMMRLVGRLFHARVTIGCMVITCGVSA